MSKLRTWRSSAPLAVSIIAVILAVTGTSIALPGKNTVNSGDIKKNAVKSSDVKNNGVTGTDVNEATLDGVTAGNVHAAEIPGGCTTASAQTGGISATAAGNECNVTFPSEVTNCAIVLGTLLDFPGGGETTYRKQGGAVVQVSRRDSAGGSDTAGAFSIAAICPTA